MLKIIHKIFDRTPNRKIPGGDVIVSPANGKIIRIFCTSENIIEVDKGILSKVKLETKDVAEECYVIFIMMNVHNIHVQRAPFDSIVKNISYKKGPFNNAVYKARNLNLYENEKNSMLFYNKKRNFNFKVIQIAGKVARRINCTIKKGDSLRKGEPIGNITLGSAVVLILPKNRNIQILAKEDQVVIDGESIIAKIR